MPLLFKATMEYLWSDHDSSSSISVARGIPSKPDTTFCIDPSNGARNKLTADLLQPSPYIANLVSYLRYALRYAVLGSKGKWLHLGL